MYLYTKYARGSTKYFSRMCLCVSILHKAICWREALPKLFPSVCSCVFIASVVILGEISVRLPSLSPY